MFTTLSQLMAMALSGRSNRCQLQDLGETQIDGGLTSPQNYHDGVQVPSFNPKTNKYKITPNFTSICHSLERETSSAFPKYHHQHGKQWTETNTTSESHLFVLCVLANLSGFRTIPESAGPGVVHFLPFYMFCGQHQELAILILFLSFFFLTSIPAVGGSRLYGARQAGLGLYHTKVTMTCVAGHCDLRNCLKVPFPLLGSKTCSRPNL